MLKRYLSALGVFILLTSCSTLQNQEAANRDVKKILRSLKAARKEIKSLKPEVVAEIKRGKKELSSVNDKLAYIEKEILNLKVNQANQLRDSGGLAEVLEQISSKLEEYNYRVSTVTQKLESIDYRITRLSDVYKSVAERGKSYTAEERASRTREGARWSSMGDSLLTIQADLAELKTLVDALGSSTGNKNQKKNVRIPPFKASLKTSGGKVSAVLPKRKGGRVNKAARSQSRVVSIAPDQLYNAAYKDYLKENFDLAISEFKEYLKKFPDTEASANAIYWLGESYYAKKSYFLSIDAFRGLLKKYPKSIKTPSAMLKTSYCYIKLNKREKAEEMLGSLISGFPSSGEAELAKDTLGNLKKK